MAATTSTATVQWPVKTREVQNHHQDSRVWNGFDFRPDDVVIVTWAKSGTTWAQQIVSQLIFRGSTETNIHTMSPWVDMRLVPPEAMKAGLEAQEHRRFMKTHLPIDALNLDHQARYIFVARDFRDVIWSLHNHFYNATDTFYSILNDTPGRVGPPVQKPPADIRQYFLQHLENDTTGSHVMWPFWDFIRGYWKYRSLPNLLMVHFQDLKTDLAGQVRRIADFLEIKDLDEKQWADVVQHCSFDWMKSHAANVSPEMSDIAFVGGADTFINKGTNSRWKDVLTEEDCKLYEEKARAELGDECAEWLMHAGPIKGLSS